MKKFLIILFFIFAFTNLAKANFIELEKCIPSFGSKLPDSWTEDSYRKYMTGYIGITKPYSYQYKDKKRWNNITGFNFSNIERQHWIKELTKLDLLIQGFHFLSPPSRGPTTYSINGSTGIITELFQRNEVQVDIQREAHRQLEFFLKRKGLYDDYAKKWMREKSENIPTQIREITKYQIVEFVGDLIYAHRIDEENLRYPPEERFGILVDLNKMTVAKNMMQYIDLPEKMVHHSYSICTASDSSSSGSDQSGPSSGTAFFISNKGYMLTNNHVVEGCKVPKISYFNEEYDTKIISTDKKLDLALLKVNLKPRSYISFSNKEAKKRQQVVIAGYPLGKGLSDDLKINDGRISSVKGYENNTNEVTVDIAINPGNSGGPIVNENGQLVAIAVSGLSKEVTEGLNFGIKASAAGNFLKSNKVLPGIGNFNFSMNDDKLVELLEESTVYIFCNNFGTFASTENTLSNNLNVNQYFLDIKDFNYEGIKLGDSALEYFSRDELDEKKDNYKNIENISKIRLNDKDFYKTYKQLNIYVKTNDPKYIIHGIEGLIFVNNFVNTTPPYQCFDRVDKIADYIKKNLNYKKSFGPKIIEKEQENYKYEKKYANFYQPKPSKKNINQAYNVYVDCTDYKTNKKSDLLEISIYQEVLAKLIFFNG